MVYHVIIALNSEWNRKVGKIISLLERMGMKFTGIKTPENRLSDFTILSELILESKLNELEAMEFYRKNFSPYELKKEIKHLHGNHIELFFETDDKSINPNEVWEFIIEKVIYESKKIPLMFVTVSSDENGLNNSFIPNLFELEKPCYLPVRTLIPLGQWKFLFID